jgi:hypothetical protein
MGHMDRAKNRGRVRAGRRRPPPAPRASLDREVGGETGLCGRFLGHAPVPRGQPDHTLTAPSIASSLRLRSKPPVYPPMPPPDASTRWHGTTIGSGLAPSALPAAR